MTQGSPHSALAHAQDALARFAWAEAFDAFECALAERESPEAYEGLSWAAWWRNDADTLFRTRESAFRLYRQAGNGLGAARMAMWLAADHADFRGELSVASGWRQRALRQVPENSRHLRASGLELLVRAQSLLGQRSRAAETLRALHELCGAMTSTVPLRAATEYSAGITAVAARGGGRGLGVVTSLEFDLRPVGPEVAFAQVIYAWEDAERITRRWAALAQESPDTVTPQLLMWTIPAHPAFPPELHDRRVLIAIALYAGPAEESNAALAPWRALATPLLDQAAIQEYLAAREELLRGAIVREVEVVV